jgi:Tfp pilus assembly protein PilV
MLKTWLIIKWHSNALSPSKIRGYSKGFLLIEVLLATTVFALLTTAFVGAFLYGQESAMLAGNRNRAALLAEEGLEAARNIRDSGFSNLAIGTYGLAVTSNQWNLSGASDTNGIFTRQIIISSIDINRKNVVSTVNWQNATGCTGTPANRLLVNTSLVQLNPLDNTRVIGITISNCGATNITIDRMTVSWAGAPAGARINGININGGSVWTGNSTSGTSLNITNFTLNPAVISYPINFLDFNNNMTGTNISIVFTMTGGSTKTILNILP